MNSSVEKELSMVAQDDDAKHCDVNSRQEAHQEHDNPKLRNENIQEYKELHEQIQAYCEGEGNVVGVVAPLDGVAQVIVH